MNIGPGPTAQFVTQLQMMRWFLWRSSRACALVKMRVLVFLPYGVLMCIMCCAALYLLVLCHAMLSYAMLRHAELSCYAVVL